MSPVWFDGFRMAWLVAEVNTVSHLNVVCFDDTGGKW